MPCNALFQLGMGSARLNASQKEETFGARALAMSAEVACVSRPGRRVYLGCEGVVCESRRIRCFVEVEGVTNPVYLFTSDVEVLEAAEVEVEESEETENALEATGTEG